MSLVCLCHMMGYLCMMGVRFFRLTTIGCFYLFLQSCDQDKYCKRELAKNQAIKYVAEKFGEDFPKVRKFNIESDQESFKFIFGRREIGIGGEIIVYIRKSDCSVEEMAISQ